MARNKGSANLAASLEVLAGAPLDARLVVDTVADLTTANMFPYNYIGMPVVVKVTGDMYILTGADPTDSANWKKGSGGDVPTKTSDLTNDSGFITNAVDDLVNYYLKSETYDKTEVDNIVSAIKNSRFEVVAELPTEDIETNVIYLVPSADPQTENVKDEYINLDGTSAGWEKIGSTEIDLSDYVTTSDLNTALADYTTTTDLTALLAAKQDVMQVTTMPAASAANLGKVVQYIGTTGAYTNGYFYKCVSDGEVEPTYSWEQVNVQPAPSIPSDIDDLDDVEITSATDGQLLKYDAETNKWVNGDPESVPSDIDDLTNVNISNPTEGQALVYDETNDEWVNGSTGGGSGSLETAITSSISVGGIPSGTNYPVGTNYDNMWKDLLNPVAYPTLTNPSATLSATGAKLLEAGSTLATTMTVAFNRGSISPAYGTSGYRSGVATGYALNGGTEQSENTFSVTVDAEHLTYQATVSYESGEQPKDSEGGNYSTPLAAGSVNSNTLTYEFVDALWANTANIATIAKLALVSKSAKTKTFEFPAQTVANPEVFDVPASWTITAVDVLNTLSNQWEDCSGEFAITNVNHDDAAGTSVAYKRYTCALGYSTGARKIRIKWS